MSGSGATQEMTRIQRRNRKDIIDAAIEVIAISGFDGARMETISELSGISRSNIHYYFRTKEDLHRAVLKRAIMAWEDLWQALDRDGSPREELSKFIEGKLRFSWEQPNLSRVFAAEIFRGAPIVHPFITHEMRSSFEEACDTLRNWMDKGLLNRAEPEHVFFALWSTTQYYSDFEHVVKLVLRKPALDETDLQNAAKALTTMLVGGLVTDKGLRE